MVTATEQPFIWPTLPDSPPIEAPTDNIISDIHSGRNGGRETVNATIREPPSDSTSLDSPPLDSSPNGEDRGRSNGYFRNVIRSWIRPRAHRRRVRGRVQRVLTEFARVFRDL